MKGSKKLEFWHKSRKRGGGTRETLEGDPGVFQMTLRRDSSPVSTDTDGEERELGRGLGSRAWADYWKTQLSGRES